MRFALHEFNTPELLAHGFAVMVESMNSLNIQYLKNCNFYGTILDEDGNERKYITDGDTAIHEIHYSMRGIAYNKPATILNDQKPVIFTPTILH